MRRWPGLRPGAAGRAALLLAARLGGPAADEAIGVGSLDFLECDGPQHDPAWAAFKAALGGRPLVRGARWVGERLASQAADLLDIVETQEFGLAVAAFSARLRGEADADDSLGGFCLYGAAAAYATVAVHLDRDSEEPGLAPTAKSSVARALLLLAKKQQNDFLESSGWPLRSADLVAMLSGEDASQVRALPETFRLPCHLSLGCRAARLEAEERVVPPQPPLDAQWPASVAAVGLHTTSTMEAVSALRDAVAEAWGRGGAAGQPFEVRYAGHPCPSHSGNVHHCQMRCDLLGQCGPAADDPLADFITGAIDVASFQEREGYELEHARAALRWVPGRLAPIRDADLVLCTFPTILCVLLHELFPGKPLLFVAIANPLFAAPGCTRHEDNTVRDCETDIARGYLEALRSTLQDPSGLVQGVAAYTVTAALVGYQTGVALPLAGKAGRYLPPGATWHLGRAADVLLARTRFAETAVGRNFRTLFRELARAQRIPLRCVVQQDEGAYLPFEELASFRAVVIFPQDLGLHKFTEHYAMAMPIWMPGREWAYRLQMFIPWGMVSYSGTWLGPEQHAPDAADRPPRGHPARLLAPDSSWPEGSGLAHPPFFNAQTVPYRMAEVAFWYEFSEFVAYEGVQTFGSVPELLLCLAKVDLVAVSGAMRRFRAELWRTTRATYAAAASALALAAAAVAAEEKEAFDREAAG